MKAAVLPKKGEAVELREIPIPKPSARQLLVKVSACGVCRTDVHLIDAQLPNIKYPLIPGHQIVGRVVKKGKLVKKFNLGDRVGVVWLGHTCGVCRFCQTHRENLCLNAKFTGYQLMGGFCQYTVADYRYCFLLPKGYSDKDFAPFLCAGVIGFRAYKKADVGKNLGLYGFGSSAHIIIQIALRKAKKVFVFTRPNDIKGQRFAKKMGASWVGTSDKIPPEKLDAAIIFAPVGELVPQALQAVDKGGKVVCAGIHMTNIPSFPYRFLWEERTLTSVANVKRQDVNQFLKLIAQIPIKTKVNSYPLARIKEALADLRGGRLEGSAVITID